MGHLLLHGTQSPGENWSQLGTQKRGTKIGPKLGPIFVGVRAAPDLRRKRPAPNMAAGRVSHARHGCYPLDDYDPAAPAAVKARPAVGWAARGRLLIQPPGLDGRRTAGYPPCGG